jgi:hypothetical protein
MKFTTAPEKLAGDSIELTPLLGKLVGVFCRARDQKNTRFGQKAMTHVVVVSEGMKAGEEPLEGIMFQSYFQELKLDQWYIGIVSKQTAGRNEAWILKSDKIDKKKLTALIEVLKTVDVAVPTEVAL